MERILQENYRNYETEQLVSLYKSTQNEDILEEIMQRNRGLFTLWGQEYSLVGYDMDDKLSEAYIALLRAIDTYNEGEGVKFSSYLKTCVKQAYNRIYTNQHRQKRNTGTDPISYESLEDIHKEKSVEFTILDDLEVREFVETLEGKVKFIAVCLIDGYSKVDIARRLNIKPASVTYHCRRLESLAIKYFDLRGSERLIQAF